MAADAAWLITATSVHGGWRWLTLSIVVAVHIGLVLGERHHQVLDRRAPLIATIGLVVVAVAVRPFGSADIWSYAMYGRILGIHHAEVPTPTRSATTPTIRCSTGWRGPGGGRRPCTGRLQRGVGRGRHRLPRPAVRARLFYQGSRLTLIGTVAVLMVCRASTWTLILVALAPITLATVNGAHNDLVVGFGLLVGLWLIADGRPILGGAVMGLATLVKLLGIPAGGAVVAPAPRPTMADSAAATAGSFGVVVAGGYLVAGGGQTLHPLHRASAQVSSGSIIAGLRWIVIRTAGAGHLGLLRHSTGRTVLATVAAAVLFAAFAYRERHRPDATVFACAALLIYLITAPYALPWYATAPFVRRDIATPKLRWLSLATLVAPVRPHQLAGAQLTTVSAAVAHLHHIAAGMIADVAVPFGLQGARLAALAQIAILGLIVVGAGAASTDEATAGDAPPATARDGRERVTGVS